MEVVKLLMERGADMDIGGTHTLDLCEDIKITVIAGGRYGNTLQAVAHSGQLKILKFLLDKGADVNIQGEPRVWLSLWL